MLNFNILDILAEWSDEFNSSLITNNPLCVAIFTIDKKLVFATPAMSSLFKGDPTQSFIHPTFDKLLQSDNSIPLIFEGYLTLGDYSSINASIFVQVYLKGNKILVIGGTNTVQLLEQNATMHELNREINNLQRQLIKRKYELENTLKKLSDTNEQLTHLNATKDKFFSIISHDLRIPFNTLLGFSELLLKNASKNTPEKVQKYAESINNTSKHTFAMLENLLEWSKLQSGKLIPNKIKTNPSDLIFEVNSLCEPMALSKNINIHILTTGNESILVDREMIKTVLRNLVTNAIKFTYPQGILTIETQSINGNIEFLVSDTGIGIELDYLDKIFSIESKLSNIGTANEPSTGLGLILCKEFVELNGGKIWVESTICKGSVFKFTIPIIQTE